MPRTQQREHMRLSQSAAINSCHTFRQAHMLSLLRCLSLQCRDQWAGAMDKKIENRLAGDNKDGPAN
jgi:hypothetical protein